MTSAMDSASRRGFLKRLAFGTVAATAASMATVATATAALPGTAGAATKRKRSIKVFRFRTRNTKSCHACQLQHRYKMFLTRKIAKHHRAHPGCDCPVIPQWISKRAYRRLFEATGAVDQGFVDLRSV